MKNRHIYSANDAKNHGDSEKLWFWGSFSNLFINLPWEKLGPIKRNKSLPQGARASCLLWLSTIDHIL